MATLPDLECKLGMMRRWPIAGWLLLAAAPVLMAGPETPAKVRAAPPPRPAAPPKGGAKINNPGASMVQRLMQMTPEQRERALEKLPPAQQAQIRQRLERFDSLPQQQRQRMIEQYRQFSSLPPDTQRLVTSEIQAVNHLPEDRGPIVRAELQRLRRMPDNQRQARLASDDFKNKFTPAEQKMLEDISENLPLPPPLPPR
jgi:hypothetical protein